MRQTLDPNQRPLVLAHRGASGYRPEHTKPAYELAVEMGADFIEPDLVSTKDGFLLDRHEPEIGATTDVSRRPKFAGRRRTKKIDGETVRGWFAHDFSMAELRGIRAVERIPKLRPDNTAHDGRWPLLDLGEVLALREKLSAKSGREIGVAPEIKHSTYSHLRGFDPERELMKHLTEAGLNRADSPVWIQSFELSNLIRLRTKLDCQVKLLLLATRTGRPFDFVRAKDPRTYADLLTPKGLGELSQWIDGIGPEKSLVIPRDGANRLTKPTRLVAHAHDAGLQVIPWTFRAENHFLPAELQVASADGSIKPSRHGKAVDEVLAFLEVGIDAVFGDNPDVSRTAVDQFLGT